MCQFIKRDLLKAKERSWELASTRPGNFQCQRNAVISAALSGRRQDKKRQRVAEESSAAFEETRAKWQSWHELDQDLSSSRLRDSSLLNCVICRSTLSYSALCCPAHDLLLCCAVRWEAGEEFIADFEKWTCSSRLDKRKTLGEGKRLWMVLAGNFLLSHAVMIRL